MFTNPLHTLCTACLLLALAFCTACRSLSLSGPSYTSDSFPRENQQIWFTPDEITSTVRLVASCISASEMITDRPRAVRRYAEYLRLCYHAISLNGADVDAGIRALNFIHKLHRDADGSAKLWQDAVTLAQDTQDDSLPGIPLPAQYR